MKLFLQKKCKIFERWGLHPQTPVHPAAWGFPASDLRASSLRPPLASGGWMLHQPPTQPPIAISGYARAQYSSAVLHKKCVDLIEHHVKCLLECGFITLLVTVC